LQELDEIEAIKQLKARYFRLMDTKQWDQFGELFTEDATLAASPDPKETFHGRADIVRRVSAALREATTVHHGHMPEIELTGPDTARGIWSMEDYVEFPNAPDGARVGLRGYGHYHEEYRRDTDGQWRIARLHLSRLRIDPL
jgi:uncharacterized protein (TIGR02246 family)